MDSPILNIFSVEDDSMVEGTGSIGQNVLNTLTQRTQKNFKQTDTNESGGLDINEVQARTEKKGQGQKIVDNFCFYFSNLNLIYIESTGFLCIRLFEILLCLLGVCC